MKYDIEEYDLLLEYFEDGQTITLQDINIAISDIRYALDQALEIRDKIKES